MKKSYYKNILVIIQDNASYKEVEFDSLIQKATIEKVDKINSLIVTRKGVYADVTKKGAAYNLYNKEN